MENYIFKVGIILSRILESDNDMVSQFDSSNDADKIRIILKLLTEKTDLNKIINYFKSIPKNNSKSEIFRKKGNEYFSNKRDLVEAIEYYNKSLCYAENNSENLGLSYANRSAIYLEWKNYDKCLENIELAKINNYPKNLLEKLNKREIICKEKLSKKISKTQLEYPKVAYKPHKKVSFIAECLELEENETFGRYIKTNIDLEPGELIAFEEPVSTTGNNLFKYKRCTLCLNENLYSLIPCHKCTSAMFCNQECYKNASEQFHRLECNIIDCLQGIYEPYLLPTRIVLTLFSNLENLSELKTFTDSVEMEKANVFTIDHSKMDFLTKYYTIHNFNTHRKDKSKSKLMQAYIFSAVVYTLLLKNPLIKEIFKIKENETLFLNVFLHNILTAENMRNLFFSNDLTSVFCNQTYGNAAYGFSCLLNHSCAPNISRFQYGTRMIIFVLRPIKKGEQLFDNYGFHHFEKSRDERRRELFEGLYFTCQCEACTNNYPMIRDLLSKKQSNVPNMISVSQLNCDMYDPLYAKEHLKKYCKFLSKYDKYYPCAQLILVQEAVKICFHNNYIEKPLKFFN